MEIDNLNSAHSLEFARFYSALIHRTRGVLTSEGATTVCQLLSAPSFERTDMCGGDGFAR